MTSANRKRTARTFVHRGYTLVEVAVATLILGLVLVGALKAVSSSVRTNEASSKKLNAPHLGHQLMAEILALPYEDPEEPGLPIGLNTGESNMTRSDFDDLDDYDGWSGGPPQAKDGTAVPNAAGWQRQASVQYFDPSTGAPTASDTGVKLVTVQIIPPVGANFALNALRSRWGALEQDSPIDTTLINSLDGELQIGSGGTPARSAARLQNHANAP